MARALVTIEVDIDTYHCISDASLGESSNPRRPGIRWIEEKSRGWIWDEVHKMLENKKEFIGVKKVSLMKEGK